MPPTPWKTFVQPDPDREYLALLTYLPLKHYRTIPRFVGYTRRIEAQLAETVGLVGYAVRAQLLRRDFWTLSVWEDEGALQQFIHEGFHSGVMTILIPDMRETNFVRHSIKGCDYPPSWESAMRSIEA